MATKKKTTNGVSATAQMSLLLSTVDKDSTRNIYRGNINVFKRFLEDENITEDNLEKYKEYLIGKGQAVTTINNCLSSLKIYFGRLIKRRVSVLTFTLQAVIKLKK